LPSSPGHELSGSNDLPWALTRVLHANPKIKRRSGAGDPALCRANVFLFAHLRLGPFNRDALIPGVRLNPFLLLIGPARQDCLVNHRLTDYVVEKMHYLPGPRQTAQIPVDDDPVKTVVYKNRLSARIRETLVFMEGIRKQARDTGPPAFPETSQQPSIQYS
jgi:hypothetical protein